MSEFSLRSGNTTAKVRLKGAQLTSFKGADGREVMWQADPAVWPNYAPVLFPVCGATPDSGLTIDGISYKIAKHGFTRNPDFTLVRKGEDFIELVLTPTEESKPVYPFEFAFHVIYTLSENSYTTTFMVENKSDKVMPFCVGGHPGFIVPMEEGAAYEDYQLVFPEKEDGKNSLSPGGYLLDGYEYLPDFHDSDTLPLKHEWFDSRDALIFTELKSRSVKLVNKNSGHGLRFDFPKMEVLAVWSKPNANAPYVCLEPWHGKPSAVEESGKFEDKAFVTMLQPGECWQGSFTTTLI